VQVPKKVEHGTAADGQDKPPPRATDRRSCDRWSFDLFLRVWPKEKHKKNIYIYMLEKQKPKLAKSNQNMAIISVASNL